MSGLLLRARGSRHTPRLSTRVPLVVAAACMMAVVILHGHCCHGDGCVLCLVAHGAQALLCVSCGVALALPLLMPLMVCLGWCLAVPVIQACGTRCAITVLLVAQTPVTQKTKLLI